MQPAWQGLKEHAGCSAASLDTKADLTRQCIATALTSLKCNAQFTEGQLKPGAQAFADNAEKAADQVYSLTHNPWFAATSEEILALLERAWPVFFVALSTPCKACWLKDTECLMLFATSTGKGLPDPYPNPDPHTQDLSYAEEVTWVHLSP